MSESEEEAQFGEEEEEDDDDDMPLSSLKKKESKKSSPGGGGGGGTRESPKRKRSAVNYAVDDDDDEEEEEEEEEDFDEDDDDIPLAALKKSPSKSSSSKAKPKAKAAPAKKKAKAKAPAPAPAASVSKSTEYLTPSSALYDSGSKKGMLIQKLLCRWWYATTWPDSATLPEKMKHYDKLDGFEGVFICTTGDKVGHIIDKRDQESRPCFANYAKKPSSELKDMLLKALEEQKRQLIEAEGAGTPTEKAIDDDIKWVNKKVNPDSADKEAVKVLKAAKMKL